MVVFALNYNVRLLYGSSSIDDRIVKKMCFNLIFATLSGKALLEARANRIIVEFFDQMDLKKLRSFPHLKYKNQVFINKIVGHSLVLNSFRIDLLVARFNKYQDKINQYFGKNYKIQKEFTIDKNRQKKLIQLYLGRCN